MILTARSKLLETDANVEEAEKSQDQVEKMNFILRAIDCATSGVRFADEAQESYLHAQLNARLGHIYPRKLQELLDEAQQLAYLKKADEIFAVVIRLTKDLTNITTAGEWDGDGGDQWYVEFRRDFIDLKQKINELERESMNAEERQADDEVKEKVEEVKQKFATSSCADFVQWIIETHIEAKNRKSLPK